MNRLAMLTQARALAQDTLLECSALNDEEYKVKSQWENQDAAIMQVAYDFLMAAAQVLADQREAQESRALAVSGTGSRNCKL